VGGVLVDYRTGVELFGDVVSGGADGFDASVVGAAVEVGPDEGREKGVRDVDDAVRISIDDIGCEDLHVAGEHDEVYLVLVEQIEHLRSCAALFFWATGKWWKGMS
jgi:hypothetical protein